MDNTLNAEDKGEEPKVGMMFDTIDEVKEYYRRYANELGFPIKNRTSRRDDDGECIYVVFACSHAGKAVPTSRNDFRRRPSTRTDCKAKLSAAIRPDGKWQVTIIKCDHNHALTPGKSHLRKWGRKIRPFAKRKVEMDDRAGSSFNKNPSAVEAGGYHNVSLLRLGRGDVSAAQNYFLKMQANSSSFFYMMDFDDEGRLRNVFWADARSRAAYEEYGDAITFDTTYLTNKYDMPLVPFIGVNHHGQSTLLGCGLLSNEDTDTFTWLFRSWLACMSGCAPKTIITDQDKAIQNAIEIVFPSTRHRWCLWHIMKKLPQKLRGYKQYESIKVAFQNVVNDSLTCDEFEEQWNRLIEKYSLQSNEWLLGLYDERHRWVPIFLKDSFWAGMSNTQRSESMQAFFDGHINSKTTLKQFVEKYEKVLRSKVEKENQEDFNSFNSLVPCITHYAMEKQFQDAYTTTKFKEFQQELTGKIYCQISSVKKDVACSEYEISEDLKIGDRDRRATFKVSLMHDDCDIHCSCGLFEYMGILCRHAIVVLIHNRILSVPEKYIIPQWRKDLKRRHSKMKISCEDRTGKPEGVRFNNMRNAFCEVADLSIDSEDKTKMVMGWIDDIDKELKRHGICGSGQPTITMNGGTTTTGGDVIPISPPFKRKQSKVKQVRKNKEKQKRVESQGKNIISGSTMQESQMIEGVDVGYVDGAIFGAQESIGFKDSEIRSHGMHIGGTSDELPTLHFANANLTLWGVPQSGQPSISRGGIFGPPKLTFGHGLG